MNEITYIISVTKQVRYSLIAVGNIFKYGKNTDMKKTLSRITINMKKV